MTRWTDRLTGAAVVVVAIVIFRLLARSRQVDYGDVPTWLAFIAAGGAGWIAFRSFRSQQKEFDRQVRQLERQQADAIDLVVWPGRMANAIWHPQSKGESPSAEQLTPDTVLGVGNKSSRPIRDVRCRLWQEGDALYKAPYATGPAKPVSSSSLPSVFPLLGADVPVLRSGQWYGFLFEEKYRKGTQYAVRFMDDSGLHWQIDGDLHLRTIEAPADW